MSRLRSSCLSLMVFGLLSSATAAQACGPYGQPTAEQTLAWARADLEYAAVRWSKALLVGDWRMVSAAQSIAWRAVQEMYAAQGRDPLRAG